MWEWIGRGLVLSTVVLETGASCRVNGSNPAAVKMCRYEGTSRLLGADEMVAFASTFHKHLDS